MDPQTTITGGESQRQYMVNATAKPIPIVSPEGPAGEEFLDDVRAILASGQLTNGTRVNAFENAVAAYLGAAHCVAVSSCTAGLMLTLRALELRGEVILPSFTFHATAHSILWNGLRPVFADCDARTFCIDPDAAEKKISRKTAAIAAVHMFGCPAPIDRLEEICARHGIPLICDAAHAFGSKAGGRYVGGFGASEIFSFSPTKLVVAGEGGLIATNSGALAQRLKAARNYGDAGNSDPEILGLNARMSEIHAALALRGLRGVEARIARRNQIRLDYEKQLASIPGIQFQEIAPRDRSACKDMSILVDESAFGTSRDSLQAFLRENDVETRRYFWPAVHQQKLYRNIWDGQSLAVTERVSSRVLSLPIYSSLQDEDVARICRVIRRAFELAQHSRRSTRAARKNAAHSSAHLPVNAARIPEKSV
jgi:dTDP-4-amino-4,6-dideoxygalactose transaminase